MPESPSVYHGLPIALATRHAKQTAIAPAFHALLHAEVRVADVDTDALGTFTGERPRPGSAPEVCERKARLGMAALGISMGVASEGSFGPHPLVPFVAGGVEWMTFVDDTRRLIITEELVADETNFAHCEVTCVDEIVPWLGRARFPSHALIVRPVGADGPIDKGIGTPDALEAAIARAIAASPPGIAHVETDMRAHLNPTRMRVIAQLAERLAARLARRCDACGAPGWGRTDVVWGLPCAWCGDPTSEARADVWHCVACGHREERPRGDGRTAGDPGRCARCNP